jgi:hypothetical protein
MAKMVQGKKNTTILYNKTHAGGCGKSSLFKILVYRVLGDKIAIIIDTAEPLTSKNNSLFKDKILVFFEELKGFNKNDYSTVDTKFKNLADARMITIGEMHTKAYQIENIMNIAMNTNVNSLQDAQNRRIVTTDVSTKRKGDDPFWKKFYNDFDNDEFGEVYYNYLLSIDISKFNEMKLPKTETKMDVISQNIGIEYKFLKFEYILKNKSYRGQLTKLYNEFLKYYSKMEPTKTYKSVYQFGEMLREINIPFHLSGGCKIYYFEVDKLKKYFEENNWIHELDYEIKEHNELKENNYFFDNDDDYEVIHNLKEENEELKKQLIKQTEEIEKLKKQMIKLQTNQITTYESLIKKAEEESKQIDNEYNELIKDSPTEEPIKRVVACIQCLRKFKTSKFKKCKTCRLEEELTLQLDEEEDPIQVPKQEQVVQDDIDAEDEGNITNQINKLLALL